jgi:putative endonuclease
MNFDGERHPAVYLMASRRHGALYVGVTSALWDRVSNHKNDVFKGFTSQYGVKMLVWYEHHPFMEDAIRREKQIKTWKRDWKIRTIELMNPGWRDLHEAIDATATLVVSKRGPSMRWGDGKDGEF